MERKILFKENSEVSFSEVHFKKHKFNNRPIPKDKKQILIVTCFSEFGCEMIGVHYCLPQLLALNPGRYVVVVGWWGRKYLYQHLADEFWELQEEYQPLREYSNAFQNTSKVLEKVEKELTNYGNLIKGVYFGNIALSNICKDCKNSWAGCDYLSCCPACKSTNINLSLLADIKKGKEKYFPIPRKDSKEILVKENSVGIFARGRKKWRRNLPEDFYVWLINELKEKGYNPVWLGEKQSVQKCPVNDVYIPDSYDLKYTFDLVSQLKFTIQFWTASTRIAAAVKTPYILFESVDEVIGKGQEGARLALTTHGFDKKKLVFCNYVNFVSEIDNAKKLTIRAIEDIEKNDWRDLVALTANPQDVVKKIMKKTNNWWN